MKKFQIFILMLVWLLAIQNTFAQKIGTLVILDDNKEIEIYKSVSIDDFNVNTYNADGKSIKFKRKAVKKMSANGHEFRLLEEGRGRMQLMEILAISDKYMLTSYAFDHAHYWFIFDLAGNNIIGKTPYNSATSFKEAALEKIKPYFIDCPDLIEKFEKNLAIKRQQLFEGIENFQCEK